MPIEPLAGPEPDWDAFTPLCARSFSEQLMVETCFLDKGDLLPTFHKFYWMGLRTGAGLRRFALLQCAHWSCCCS
jgi:hypothetical protein